MKTKVKLLAVTALVLSLVAVPLAAFGQEIRALAAELRAFVETEIHPLREQGHPARNGEGERALPLLPSAAAGSYGPAAEG